MRFKLACTLLGALLVFLAAGGGQGRASGGPLTSGGEGISGIERKVGRAATVMFLLANRSRTAATIERIRLLRPDPALRFLGARTLPVAKAGAGGGLVSEFPPPDLRAKDPRDAVGTSIPHTKPFGGTVVLLGLAAARPGVHALHHVVVDYHIGVQRFRAVYWVDVRICSPGTCPF